MHTRIIAAALAAASLAALPARAQEAAQEPTRQAVQQVGQDSPIQTVETRAVRDPAMMPWPLTRSELEALAGSLTVRSVERFIDGEDPPKLRWRAEFGRS